MKPKILAVGSVALDTVKTPFGKAKNALGGSATFFSASARFFAPVSIVAVVGKDFPRKHLELLKKLGVDTRGIEIVSGKTFRWSGYYDFDLNTARTLKTELNVFKNFVPTLSDSERKSGVIFLANIDPEIQAAVLEQAQKPIFTACDTMNYWIQNKKPALSRLLKKINIFLLNDAEARELSGEYSLHAAAKRILSWGPKILVIKKGEHGVACFSESSLFLAPAFLLERVFDPTGAGDSFAGGFIGYLASQSKWNSSAIRRAVIYGSVLASYNVESFSLNRIAALKKNEILKRYQQFKKITAF